jgi:hypothetical protein
MGFTSLVAMRNDVRFNMRAGEAALLNDQLTVWINRAYIHVSQPTVYEHRELMGRVFFALVADTITYGLDTATLASIPAAQKSGAATTNQFSSMQNVRFVNTTTNPPPVTAQNRVMTRETWQELDEITQRTENDPTRWAIHGTELLIDNIPGTAQAGRFLDFRAFFRPTVLLADAAFTVISEHFDMAIEARATAIGYRALEDFSRAELWDQQFSDVIADANDYESIEDANRSTNFDVRIEEAMR